MRGSTSRDAPPDDGLVPVARQRSEVLARIGPGETVELALLEAHGCVLAEDVRAEEDVPGFANSAMDGYAVVAAGLTAGEELEVIGEIPAGAAPALAVARGQAAGIMTGASLPEGADAVVPVEQAEERGGRVVVHAAPSPGAHVRAAGESVRAGERILEAGRALGAADVGMLAAVGRASARVRPRPRVTVVSTGDELVEPGEVLGPGQIRDANSYTLTALAREAGARSARQSFVPDDHQALRQAFEQAVASSDLLVTSGGVSAGRYDLVKAVLAELGDVEFRRVGMKPGMPQAFGFVRGVPCFGLPGNPVSAAVSFEVFVRPALRRMQGHVELNRPRVTATLSEPVRSPAGKVEFVRVRLRRDGSDWTAIPTGEQGSGILRSMVDADGLAEVPVEHAAMDAGQRIVVHVLGAGR